MCSKGLIHTIEYYRCYQSVLTLTDLILKKEDNDSCFFIQKEMNIEYCSFLLGWTKTEKFHS